MLHFPNLNDINFSCMLHYSWENIIRSISNKDKDLRLIFIVDSINLDSSCEPPYHALLSLLEIKCARKIII